MNDNRIKLIIYGYGAFLATVIIISLIIRGACKIEPCDELKKKIDSFNSTVDCHNQTLNMSKECRDIQRYSDLDCDYKEKINRVLSIIVLVVMFMLVGSLTLALIIFCILVTIDHWNNCWCCCYKAKDDAVNYTRYQTV